MKTPTLLELPPAPTDRRAAPLRLRAQLPTLAATHPPPRPARAAHDFLVPNPRPDLTPDAHLLLMLEAG